jgi:hypothetical protein
MCELWTVKKMVQGELEAIDRELRQLLELDEKEEQAMKAQLPPAPASTTPPASSSQADPATP